MARNLYKTASQARIIFIVLIILALVITAVDTLSKFYQRETAPQTNESERFYMTADRLLGDVPKPNIPGIEFDRSQVNYSNTSVHNQFPDSSYVYKLEEPAPKLNALENAKPTVFALGFEQDDFVQLETTLYEWSSKDGSKKVQYNTLTREWNLTTDFAKNEEALLKKDLLQTLEEYSSQAASIVSRLGFDQYGFKEGTTESTFASLGTNELFIEQAIQSNAEYVFVELFRDIAQADLKPTSEQPKLLEGQQRPLATRGKVYSNDPRFGQINLVVSNRLRDLSKDIFQLKYTNFEYNESQRGAYLTVNPNEAWNNFSRGDGSIVYLRPQGTNYFYTDLKFEKITELTADFRETELAFWEPNEYDGYVYPIYVFRGTAQVDGRLAEFTVFVDAIKRV